MGTSAVKSGSQVTPRGEDKAPMKEEVVSVSTEQESLANGPLEHRHCTDLLCCVIFTLFLVAWIGAGVFGYVSGDPALLFYPFDSDGHQCGRPGSETADYPYVYWPFPFPDTFDLRVCVRDCPSTYHISVECFNTTSQCEFYYESYYSDPDPVLGYVQGVYPCYSFLGRICIPKSVVGWAKTRANAVSDKVNIDSVMKWMGDMVDVWETLLIVASFALILAFLYLLLLRYFVGFIVWFSLLFIILMLFSLASVLLWTAHYQYQADSQEDTRRTLTISAYITFAIAGVFTLYILFICNKIRLSIAILKSATLFIVDVKTSLLLPPLFFLFTVGLYVYWVVATLHIYATGDIENHDRVFPDSNMTKTARNLYFFHFFGVLWVNAFLSALLEFTLASSVAIWYFSLNSDSGPIRPVTRSIYRAIRYHLGSLAFGSLILAVIRLFKWLMRYITSRLQSLSTNRLYRFLLSVLNCYIACFERGVKFVNRNAYIQIALRSRNFCVACWDAFELIVRNAVTFATLGSIGGVFIFLGKWTICLLSSYLGFLVLTHADRYSDISSPVFPVIVPPT